MRVAIAMSALLALMPGCRRDRDEAPEVRVTMRVSPDPPVVGRATVDLALTVPDGRPVRDAAVEIEGTMTHPGMTPSFGTARETDAGTYRSSLDLTMAGDWVVLVEARLSGGGTLRRRLDLPGVRPR